MKKYCCVLTVLLLVFVMLLSGCGDADPAPDKAADMVDFEQYESDDITDIEQVVLSGTLAERCVTYRFSYVSDANSIGAYISIPKALIDSGEKGKCILYNRGGNSNIGFLEDDTTARVCAATDRIVVASQYRGVNGKGSRDEFGGKDVNDVIKLIDLCETRFSFVDMDDFCTCGVSRGGMMTYLAAARDDRIKRIISISGVCDLTACYNDREDMRDILEYSIGGTPDDLPEEYESRSAVCWPERITVPVLMIHSKGDVQVSFSQAEELSQLFEDNGIDCTFIVHDDDVHGPHTEDAAMIREWLETGSAEE